MEKNKIVFMGTPDFAVPALNALHKNNYDVVLVVTQPDRPKGRGRRPVSPPVKKKAVELRYDVIQPISIKTEEFADRLTRLKPDIFVVAAFGHILPKRILALPKIGALNIHASLLPRYRGAAPIQWAIINGEKETGVTTMLMDEGLDTGDILLRSKTQIYPDDTSATLHDRLAELGSDLLIKTLKAIASGNINPIPQDHTCATYAPMLKKEDGRINWGMGADKLEAFIRGMTPWPGAFTFWNNTRLKIFTSRPIMTPVSIPPGTVLKGFPDELLVATGNGALSILEIQGKSGKRLAVKDFLRGFKLPAGTVLS